MYIYIFLDIDIVIIYIYTLIHAYIYIYHIMRSFPKLVIPFHVLKVQVYPVADPFGNNGWGVPRKSRPAEKNFGESSSFCGR